MNTSDLLKLLPLQRLTAEELRERDPALWEKLEESLRETARSRVIESVDPKLKNVRTQLQRANLSKVPLRELAGHFRQVVVTTAAGGAQAPAQEADRALESLGNVPQVDEKVPLMRNPDIHRLLRKAHLVQVGNIGKLEPKLVDSLANEIGRLDSLTEPALTKLVADKKLTEMQAAELGSAAMIYELADQDVKLAGAIRSAAGNMAAGADWTRKLAAMSSKDWLEVVRQHGVTPPSGTTAEELSNALSSRMATLHPDLALLGRLPKLEVDRVKQGLGELQVVLSKNPKAFERDFSGLDLSGLPPKQRQTAEAAYEELRRVVRAYPGLRLAEVLTEPGRSPEEKAQIVSRRTSLIEKVKARVGEGELLRLDFSPDSEDLLRLGLDNLGAQPEEQKLLVDTFKSFQRVYALTNSVQESQALLEAGYSSAVAIAAQPLSRFLGKSKSGKAETYWRESRATLMDTALAAGSLFDLHTGLFTGLAFGNVSPGAKDFLLKFEGFEKLFGNLAYCTCQHCQSILSPAAYFVDLMHFVHEHIGPQFGARADHTLQLEVRRPDLWTLELTCENTNHRLATLDIVNEILENYIAKQRGFAGNLSDRAAVGDVVYQRTLPGTVDSFQQPFHLPLARVNQYLSKLESSRAEVARTVGATADIVAAAELWLSPEEWQLVTQQQLNTAALNRLYQRTVTPQGGGFAPVDAQDLVAAMGIDRDQLDGLLATSFVRASGASVKVRAQKRGPDSVQNDVEKVEGFNASALDRMHRFTRLWRHLPWSIPELDRLLSATGETALDAAGVRRVASARAVQRLLGTSVDDTAALVGSAPRTPEGSSFFDRLFNSSNVAPADRFPRDTARFIHPSFRTTTAVPADPALPRLLAGLGVDLEGLATLERRLAAHLSTGTGTLEPNAANEDDRYFVLSAANLSLLYQHARLARLLNLKIDELFQLIGIAGLGEGRVTSADDVLSVAEADRWRRESGYTLDDIAMATGGTPRDATRYADSASLAANLVASGAQSLSFGDTVFSVTLGTTEQASRALLAANPGLVEETAGGRWRLVAGADLAGAVISLPAAAVIPVAPAGSRPVTAEDVRSVLRAYELSAVLARALGAAFGFDAAKVEAVARLAGASLGTDAHARALRGTGPIEPLRDLIGLLLPLAVAFKAREWDAAAIDFVRQHPERFALVPPAVTVAGLRALSVYSRLVKRTVGGAASAATVEPAELRSVLAAFDAAGPDFPVGATGQLGRVLDVSPGFVAALRGRVALPAVAAAALDVLDRAVRLVTRLGIDGESFAGLASSDFAALSRGADALLSAYGARYTSEDERKKQLDLLAEPLREKKRDALVAWLVHSLEPRRFTRPNDLYEYFLIDAEAGGCSTTSRVVAAISSVQLYIHRIIMNLEQTPPGAAEPLGLVMPESAAAEWTWRKNYRVWEANRKVFLWPENYIEPDLRDDKTPLFKELESELLQTAISDQDVLDAYTKYLRGFEELASLTIAGAYHDTSTKDGTTTDVFHLFGVAASDPPVFYYRTCENLAASGRDPKKTAVWTPWQKIDVQITGRRVAPVVYRGRLHVFWSDYKTRPFNSVRNGASEFAGYRHTMSVRYTTLRPDGTWTAPQTVSLPEQRPFGPGRGMIADSLVSQRPRLDTRVHSEPIDDYTLRGTNWDALYLDPNDDEFSPRLCIVGRNYQLYAYVDLFHRTIEAPHTPRDLPGDELGIPVLCARNFQGKRLLYFGFPSYWYPNRNAYGDLVLDEERIQRFNAEFNTEPLREGLYAQVLAEIGDIELLSISGSIEDALLQRDADVLLLQGSVTEDETYVLRRIGTTLAEDVTYRLFMGGVDGLLDIRTQMALREADIPLRMNGSLIEDRGNARQLDFKGPYGVYYREMFFHIPFLIANALNGRGNFAAAQRWYHYIFDPTATEVISVPAGTPPAERARRLLDRVWRYREFRNLDQARLRDILTDEDALAVYRKDPFNPHAIARLRLSAYQKSIVMKYVDNLLDWADSLFTQFSTESVNEALMLYVMASDVLGPRPARLGDCGEGTVLPKTYEKIKDTIGAGEEILIELESWIRGKRVKKLPKRKKFRFTADRKRVNRLRASVPLSLAVMAEKITMSSQVVLAGTASALAVRPLGEAVTKIDAAEEPQIFRGLSWKETRTGGWAPPLAVAGTASRGSPLSRLIDYRGHLHYSDWVGAFGWSIIRQISPVFCLPVNADLLEYWNRVEDRLYKIRHCQDITGQKRELALFAPPIDPRLLVRMRAAGLTLEDVLGGISGDLPPYRFLYLVERAKAFAATLSSFGAALLSALEKKEGEELNRLRMVHQQNLTRMTTQLRRWEIKVAEESLAMVERQKEAAEYRRNYYDGLVNQYRSGLETAESTLRHIVAGIHGGEALLDLTSAIFAAVPQVGSPFAMKYGGVELNTTVRRFGNAAHAVANGLQAAASSVGLEATYDRRAEGWRHQRQLAQHDIRQLDRQLEAARIRLEIANRSLEVHEKSIEQLDEMLELMDGKFSSLGLYTWLSTELRRLHRDAFQNALALARLAEQAFRFERGDETSPGLAPTYWDASHAGLLAGEQLLVDLQNLERRYLETNYRSLEVDQAFALSQVAPDALVQLRETGDCRFTVSELFFNLFYPGHYKRRIKAVRLTIPCITGPYVNVSATLTLDRSWIRTTAAPANPLTEVPPRRSVSVATSTAQNDAGVFELSFRDERYMPFEGAGAISQWVLTLPKTFRQFDYQTINDVIMSISYTAEQDGALRDHVEADNAALELSIRKVLAENAIGRIFSLRQDFSSAFNRLLHSPTGTEVRLEITDRHFPIFIANRPISVSRSALLLRTANGVEPGALQLSVDGTAVNGFPADATLGNLPAQPLPGAFTTSLRGQHVLRVENAGGLAPAAPTPGDASAVDADRLLDVLLYLEYTVPA